MARSLAQNQLYFQQRRKKYGAERDRSLQGSNRSALSCIIGNASPALP